LDIKRHVLSVLVVNHPGLLSRVSGLFSRRGYNIDSLSVGTTEDPHFSRITVAVFGDDMVIEQIRRQVEKLEDVVAITELFTENAVCHELVLIKVASCPANRSEIISLTEIFKASIVDVSNTTVTIEMAAEQNKISALVELLEAYGIKEIVRTGLTGILRGNQTAEGVIRTDIKTV